MVLLLVLGLVLADEHDHVYQVCGIVISYVPGILYLIHVEIQ